jgi:hypothetical protein
MAKASDPTRQQRELLHQYKVAILLSLKERTLTGATQWTPIEPRPGVRHFFASTAGAHWMLRWEPSGVPELSASTDVGVMVICGPMVQELWSSIPSKSRGLQDAEEFSVARWIWKDFKTTS